MLMPCIALLLAAGGSASEAVFERVKASIVTIEVHTGNQEAKSAQGSGYLVSAEGHLVTNYHVIESYVEEPERYRIRARNHTGEYSARLLRFDLVNDLAILQVEGLHAPLLAVAHEVPAPAAHRRLRNPQGLGLSLIEGIYNGQADKGVVTHAALDAAQRRHERRPHPERGGRGHRHQRLRDVPLELPLLRRPRPQAGRAPRAPPVAVTKPALRAEIQRQLVDLEAATFRRAIATLADPANKETVTVGGVEARRPPPLYECWDNTEEYKDEGITKARHGCNLQFTPSVESLGVVGYVDLRQALQVHPEPLRVLRIPGAARLGPSRRLALRSRRGGVSAPTAARSACARPRWSGR